MLRRFLSPRWILGHLGVALLVVVLINLGLWQLRRLDERQDYNAQVAERTAMAPTSGSSALLSSGEPSELEWRPVTVTGVYNPDDSLIILGRSDGGVAGTHSLVPLVADDGLVWLVNRGFVPLATATPAPPSGTVTVTGWLRRTQTRAALGAVDSSDPATVEYHRFDVALISRRIDGEVAPMWIQSAGESPASAERWPAPVPLPPADEGSHLSYAGQWFLFAAVALGGWIVLIRRASRTAPSPTSV